MPKNDGKMTQRPFGFTVEEFSARRRAVMEKIGWDAVALLPGAGPVYGFENFRQTNEFYYYVVLSAAVLFVAGRRRGKVYSLPARTRSADGTQ